MSADEDTELEEWPVQRVFSQYCALEHTVGGHADAACDLPPSLGSNHASDPQEQLQRIVEAVRAAAVTMRGPGLEAVGGWSTDHTLGAPYFALMLWDCGLLGACQHWCIVAHAPLTVKLHDMRADDSMDWRALGGVVLRAVQWDGLQHMSTSDNLQAMEQEQEGVDEEDATQQQHLALWPRLRMSIRAFRLALHRVVQLFHTALLLRTGADPSEAIQPAAAAAERVEDTEAGAAPSPSAGSAAEEGRSSAPTAFAGWWRRRVVPHMRAGVWQHVAEVRCLGTAAAIAYVAKHGATAGAEEAVAPAFFLLTSSAWLALLTRCVTDSRVHSRNAGSPAATWACAPRNACPRAPVPCCARQTGRRACASV